MNKAPPNLRQDLTLHELECLQKLYVGDKLHYIDQASTYAGYYLQMKLYGTMTFRILHSHGTWIKVKKALESVGFDIDSIPDWTDYSERVAGVRWYKNDLMKASDIWAFLVGIDRRGKARLDEIEPKA